MLERQLYWSKLKVAKPVFESLKGNVEWSRSNHLLTLPATQAAVIMVLWVVAKTPILRELAGLPELVDMIVEHVVRTVPCKKK